MQVIDTNVEMIDEIGDYYRIAILRHFHREFWFVVNTITQKKYINEITGSGFRPLNENDQEDNKLFMLAIEKLMRYKPSTKVNENYKIAKITEPSIYPSLISILNEDGTSPAEKVWSKEKIKKLRQRHMPQLAGCLKNVLGPNLLLKRK